MKLSSEIKERWMGKMIMWLATHPDVYFDMRESGKDWIVTVYGGTLDDLKEFAKAVRYWKFN